MGMFVVGPLLEELGEACAGAAPALDARRCLEVLVPLAYRPAIKVGRLSRKSSTCACGKVSVAPDFVEQFLFPNLSRYQLLLTISSSLLSSLTQGPASQCPRYEQRSLKGE